MFWITFIGIIVPGHLKNLFLCHAVTYHIMVLTSLLSLKLMFFLTNNIPYMYLLYLRQFLKILFSIYINKMLKNWNVMAWCWDKYGSKSLLSLPIDKLHDSICVINICTMFKTIYYYICHVFLLFISTKIHTYLV